MNICTHSHQSLDVMLHLGTDFTPSRFSQGFREFGTNLDIDIQFVEVTFARYLQLILGAQVGVLQKKFLDLRREDIRCRRSGTPASNPGRGGNATPCCRL